MVDVSADCHFATHVWKRYSAGAGHQRADVRDNRRLVHLPVGMAISDGGVNITGSPLLITADRGPRWLTVAGNYYPPITPMRPMEASLTTLVPGEYIQNSAITNPVKVIAYGSGAIGLLGNYTLSGSPNAAGSVGSSGSPVVFTGNDDHRRRRDCARAGADHSRPGAVHHLPPHEYRREDGHDRFVGRLRHRDAWWHAVGHSGARLEQRQWTAARGLHALQLGCADRNNLRRQVVRNARRHSWRWTLHSSPSAPRTASAMRHCRTRSRSDGFSLCGVRARPILSRAGQSGTNTSYFSGLWGFGSWDSAFGGNEHYLQGPPITANFVPGQPLNNAGDRFGVGGFGIPISEAVSAFDQELSNAFAVPATFLSATRDGVGAGIYTLGNVAQTQTIGAGDGSNLTWCSASKFCGHVDVGSSLVFNAASLTGGWFSGSISGSTLTATTRQGGALEPGMVLNVTGSPTLLNCLSNCTSINFSASTWALSSSAASGVTGTHARRCAGVSTAVWRDDDALAEPQHPAKRGGSLCFRRLWNVRSSRPARSRSPTPIRRRAFRQRSARTADVFAYNQTGGNCTGANVASSFVNYQTGDYQITFTSGHAPLSGHAITASWTNIISPESPLRRFSIVRRALDFFGDGTAAERRGLRSIRQGAGRRQWSHLFRRGNRLKPISSTAAAASNVGYQWGGSAIRR